MSDSLRPLESSSIDAELPIRLEGQIELLEDALPLFDSVLLALGRKAWTEDDRVTLRECVLQLPRIEEAVERATQHAQATRLTRAPGEKRREVEVVAKARLGEVGAMAPPSLRAMLSAILELNRRQAIEPESGLALLTGAGVLFVPKDRGELAVRAPVEGPLRVVPEPKEVLGLVARLPAERLRALAVRLGELADAVWLGRGEVLVERSANANLGVVVRSAPHPGPLPAGAGRGRFRVMFYEQAVVAEALRSRLQAT